MEKRHLQLSGHPWEQRSRCFYHYEPHDAGTADQSLLIIEKVPMMP